VGKWSSLGQQNFKCTTILELRTLSHCSQCPNDELFTLISINWLESLMGFWQQSVIVYQYSILYYNCNIIWTPGQKIFSQNQSQIRLTKYWGLLGRRWHSKEHLTYSVQIVSVRRISLQRHLVLLTQHCELCYFTCTNQWMNFIQCSQCPIPLKLFKYQQLKHNWCSNRIYLFQQPTVKTRGNWVEVECREVSLVLVLVPGDC